MSPQKSVTKTQNMLRNSVKVLKVGLRKFWFAVQDFHRRVSVSLNASGPNVHLCNEIIKVFGPTLSQSNNLHVAFAPPITLVINSFNLLLE